MQITDNAKEQHDPSSRFAVIHFDGTTYWNTKGNKSHFLPKPKGFLEVAASYDKKLAFIAQIEKLTSKNKRIKFFEVNSDSIPDDITFIGDHFGIVKFQFFTDRLPSVQHHNGSLTSFLYGGINVETNSSTEYIAPCIRIIITNKQNQHFNYFIY